MCAFDVCVCVRVPVARCAQVTRGVLVRMRSNSLSSLLAAPLLLLLLLRACCCCVRAGADPAAVAVMMEDGAAVAGLFIAGGCLALCQVRLPRC